MFREVDFTEFHFTRHMLQTLQAVAPDRFALVAEELQVGLGGADARAAGAAAGPGAAAVDGGSLPPDAPGAIRRTTRCWWTTAMMDGGAGTWRRTMLEVVSQPPGARAQGAGGHGLSRRSSRPAAAGVPGPAVHREVAAALAPRVQRLL